MTGELEHTLWRAWRERAPDVMVIEGQGALLNPAYPGGIEILAAARPDVVVLQHAPMRKEYDGFPGYPIQPLERQIQAIESVSECRVGAITLHHEGMTREEVAQCCADLSSDIDLPVTDVLSSGESNLVSHLIQYLSDRPAKKGSRLAVEDPQALS